VKFVELVVKQAEDDQRHAKRDRQHMSDFACKSHILFDKRQAILRQKTRLPDEVQEREAGKDKRDCDTYGSCHHTVNQHTGIVAGVIGGQDGITPLDH
jgi:hypothetical protein